MPQKVPWKRGGKSKGLPQVSPEIVWRRFVWSAPDAGEFADVKGLGEAVIRSTVKRRFCPRSGFLAVKKEKNGGVRISLSPEGRKNGKPIQLWHHDIEGISPS